MREGWTSTPAPSHRIRPGSSAAARSWRPSAAAAPASAVVRSLIGTKRTEQARDLMHGPADTHPGADADAADPHTILGEPIAAAGCAFYATVALFPAISMLVQLGEWRGRVGYFAGTKTSAARTLAERAVPAVAPSLERAATARGEDRAPVPGACRGCRLDRTAFGPQPCRASARPRSPRSAGAFKQSNRTRGPAPFRLRWRGSPSALALCTGCPERLFPAARLSGPSYFPAQKSGPELIRDRLAATQ
jgi:hypothetical protein